MNSITGNIRLIFEEGIEVTYTTELNILWMIQRGSILKLNNQATIEILDIETYFNETDKQISFLLIARVRLLYNDEAESSGML